MPGQCEATVVTPGTQYQDKELQMEICAEEAAIIEKGDFKVMADKVKEPPQLTASSSSGVGTVDPTLAVLRAPSGAHLPEAIAVADVTLAGVRAPSGARLPEVFSEIMIDKELHAGVGFEKAGFLELFAGTARLTAAVAHWCADLVECAVPLDIYEEWDICTERGFDQALQAVRRAAWTHAAPPCSTFSRGRAPPLKPLRSEKHVRGFGDARAEEANEIVKRWVMLARVVQKDGKCWSMENPSTASCGK